ncbi:hypothetical protein GCM10007962_13360 [Yeosuana aromativorans]|uniref:DUF2188 domain-containing protein n=1 Tax=Yeosuana aromativorans TaxID=288019 RepID=A0A8J3BKA6_9FLAO|nr:DUF2188 domain-containing protein [Yeosuana aromativorans]GGK20559.1 hypothetical protein GCM10007962_13360 [Yeosuana aromativorans]
MGKNQYVVPTDDGWGVKGEKNEKLTKKFNKKAEAVDYAKDIAKNQKSELTILKKDGKIQNKNSYGNDPNPPKDKKP